MPHQIKTLPAALIQPVALPRATLRHLSATLAQCASRLHSRRALTRLTAQQLHDIGMTTATAQAETQKPFWRA